MKKLGSWFPKEILIKDIIGKTISGFELSISRESAILVFDDGEFVWLTAACDEEYRVAYLGQGTMDIQAKLSFGDKKLISLGVTTKEELYYDRAELKKIK